MKQQSAFGECLAHKPKVELLEVADATVHEFAREAGCSAGEVASFEQAHVQATRGRVEGCARSHNARTHNQDVELLARHHLEGASTRLLVDSERGCGGHYSADRITEVLSAP